MDNKLKISTDECETCGHKWISGMDGIHECSDYMLRKSDSNGNKRAVWTIYGNEKQDNGFCRYNGSFHVIAYNIDDALEKIRENRPGIKISQCTKGADIDYE